jgi:hypothetical protein
MGSSRRTTLGMVLPTLFGLARLRPQQCDAHSHRPARTTADLKTNPIPDLNLALARAADNTSAVKKVRFAVGLNEAVILLWVPKLNSACHFLFRLLQKVGAVMPNGAPWIAAITAVGVVRFAAATEQSRRAVETRRNPDPAGVKSREPFGCT